MVLQNNSGKSENKFYLSGNDLSTFDLLNTIDSNIEVVISEETQKKILSSRSLLDDLIQDNRIIYGVNTSMGGFVDWLISPEHAEEVQNNLIASVATNVGKHLPDRVVLASMLARLNSLARGVSAISLENFLKLLAMYNKRIIPCIPSKGSLGASGDLGPLACIAMVGTGKWKAKFQNKVIPGIEALESAGIEPMKLGYKEGLSLINGTSVMTGFASVLIEESISLLKSYDVISCLTFEGLKVMKKAFDPTVHAQKKHRGQLQTSKNIWNILKNSKLLQNEAEIEQKLNTHKNTTPVATNLPIEDAYSIRCTPQIIGAIKDTLLNVQSTIENELNSSSDNPLVIPQSREVYHNGHFHGQYISMSMDQLSTGLTSLINLSDRRIDRFMDKNHSNELPPFLCQENPGNRLGLMGGQFMATSITAESRSLCIPLSIQTLTSTGDFQDHVSMGLIAVRRASEIFKNATYVLAFELICACQAIDIRKIQDELSSATTHAFKFVRRYVPYIDKDICLTDYIEILADVLKSGELLKYVEKQTGSIKL